MSFRDTVTKLGKSIGKVSKKTYGPLEPLLEPPTERQIYRYPMDVDNTQRYPHTVEFQTWQPTQRGISELPLLKPVVDFISGTEEDQQVKEGTIGFRSQLNSGDGQPIASADMPMMTIERNRLKYEKLLQISRVATPSHLITMYLPQGTWNDRINNLYNQKSLTEAFGEAGFLLEAGTSLLGIYSGTDKSLGERSKELVNGPAGMEALGAVANRVGLDGATIRDAGLSAMGYALNPQFEMLYSGTDLREFQFDFVMTPRTADESLMIYNIIKKFKYHASPEFISGQGRYVLPPSYFEITFKFNGEESDWLPQLSTCVLKSVDVDYTGGLEQWAAHADGSPVQVRMVLIFQEMEMMHKSLRKKGY